MGDVEVGVVSPGMGVVCDEPEDSFLSRTLNHNNNTVSFSYLIFWLEGRKEERLPVSLEAIIGRTKNPQTQTLSWGGEVGLGLEVEVKPPFRVGVPSLCRPPHPPTKYERPVNT